MNIKIGFIASNAEMYEQIQTLYRQQLDDGTVLLCLFSSETLLQDARSLINSGASAIISRGTIADTLRQLQLGVPVSKIEITSAAILKALLKAKNLQNKVYYMAPLQSTFQLRDWENLIDFQVEIVKGLEGEALRDFFYSLKESHEAAVIVGGPLTVKEAKHFGLHTVMIEILDSAIIETYQRTEEIAMNVYQSGHRNSVLSGILNNVSEGILVLDKYGSPEYCNQLMHDYFPSLQELPNALNGGTTAVLQNYVIEKGGLRLSLDACPLEIDNQLTGTLYVCHDITKLQKMEEDIRYKLSQKGLKAHYTFDDIFTCSPEMEAIIKQAKRFAETEKTVLIYGESGTGKEILAQSIHNQSRRKNAPFVAINCAALSESLLESELFGYEEGSFTGSKKGGKQGIFELAHNGTVFLDEINSMPLSMQSKILRVIEEKEVMRIRSDRIIPLDIRILTASNEDLYPQVASGTFRRDLFYRLNVLDIRLPNLCDRSEDILPLLHRFWGDSLPMSPALEHKVLHYRWPGNIRELKNFAEKYKIIGEEGTYFFADTDVPDFPSPALPIQDDSLSIDLKGIQAAIEDAIITHLSNSGLSKNEIASVLGISRTSLWKKTNRE